MSIKEVGYISHQELIDAKQDISAARYAKGPVAVVECVQEIPCNPCEAACKFGAITIGEPITNLPKIQEDLCTGCGVCVAQCPGLAIFIVNKAYSDTEATVAFPYEYTPVPKEGEVWEAVDRKGTIKCEGKIVKVMNPKAFDRTPVVTVAIPKEFADEVRSVKRK